MLMNKFMDFPIRNY